MRYIKYIILSAVLLLAFQAKAQVKAVLSVEDEAVINGNYHFSIIARTADNNTAGPLYLGNADFVLIYDKSLFTNPTFEKVSNETSLLDSEGEEGFVSALINNNLSTSMATGDLIVNLNGINPSSNEAFQSVPKIDGTPCEYKIGEFQITGLNDPTVESVGLAWRSSGAIPTDVYSYDPINPFNGFAADLTFENGECASTLPVEFLGLTATNEGDYNLLTWKTLTEQNSDFFEVQKSKDGVSFGRIGTVDAAGTSLQARSYDFSDNEPFISSYYRLRMVDLDGSFTYSNIEHVTTRLEDDIAVFPVPAKDLITLVYDSDNTSTVVINVLDAIGQSLLTRQEGTAQGINTFQLDISQLAAGSYFVNVLDDSGVSKVRPFVKK